MELTTLKCISCGANLDIIENKKEIKCPYCNSINIIMRPVKYSQTNFTLSSDENKKLINLTTIIEKSIGAGNYSEAYNYCNKALEIDPSSASLWLNKALCAFWIRNEKTIIYNQGKEIFTYLNTAKANNPNQEEYDEVTKNIAYNLYYYCLYMYWNTAPDIYNHEMKENVYSSSALTSFFELLTTMELCFDIYKDTKFLKTIIKELSGKGFFLWGYVDGKGVESYEPFGEENKKYYDGLVKRNEIIEKIKSVEPDYIPTPLPIKKPDYTGKIAFSIIIVVILIIAAYYYLKDDKEVSIPKTENTNVVEPEMYSINAPALNLRSGQGENYDVILKINGSEYVQVIDKSNPDWFKVKYNGKTGYVSSKFLKKY